MPLCIHTWYTICLRMASRIGMWVYIYIQNIYDECICFCMTTWLHHANVCLHIPVYIYSTGIYTCRCIGTHSSTTRIGMGRSWTHARPHKGATNLGGGDAGAHSLLGTTCARVITTDCDRPFILTHQQQNLTHRLLIPTHHQQNLTHCLHSNPVS